VGSARALITRETTWGEFAQHVAVSAIGGGLGGIIAARARIVLKQAPPADLTPEDLARLERELDLISEVNRERAGGQPGSTPASPAPVPAGQAP
jgi:hypothetical protein